MTRYDQGVKNLNDLENMLIEIEVGKRNITRRMLIGVIRAVWWLYESWVREHGRQ